MLSHVVRQTPQIVDGRISYVICGSAALNLLAMAERLETLDNQALPGVKVGRVLDLSVPARQTLAANIREIGDLDVAVFEMVALRESRPRKGRNALDGFRAEAGTVTELYWDSSIMKAEQLRAQQNVVRAQVAGQAFYIAHPLDILKHLVSFSVQAQSVPKFGQTLGDLTILLKGLEQVFDDQAIVEAALSGLMLTANYLAVPFWRPGSPDPIDRLATKALDSHPDASLVRQLKLNQAYSFTALRLISTQTSSASKRKMADFLDRHAERLEYRSDTGRYHVNQLFSLLFRLPPHMLGEALETIEFYFDRGTPDHEIVRAVDFFIRLCTR